MSETPTYVMPEQQNGLSDHEIENPYAYQVEAHNFDLGREEAVDPALWNVPEYSHETVQPPVFELETFSHEQRTAKSIEVTPHLELVRSVADAGRNLGMVRRDQIAA